MGLEKNRFICYAHRILSDAAFEPEIIDRYPKNDRPELIFPDAITQVFYISLFNNIIIKIVLFSKWH